MRTLYVTMILLFASALMVSAQQDKISYDEHGRISSVRYANGQEIRYQYDGYNNLTSVKSVVASVPEQEQTPAVSVRPNPATERVTIEVQALASTAVTFRVVSTDGRQILRRQVLADHDGRARTTLDRVDDGLSHGQYIIAVATTTGRGTTSVTFTE